MHLHLFTDHIRRADVHSTIDGTAWLELTMDEGGCLALFAREQGGLGKMDLQFIGDIINKALTDHSFEVYWAELDTLLDEAGLPGTSGMTPWPTSSGAGPSGPPSKRAATTTTESPSRKGRGARMTQTTLTELLQIRDRLRSLRGVQSHEATAERLYLAWRLRCLISSSS